jgi:hypothetical protein
MHASTFASPCGRNAVSKAMSHDEQQAGANNKQKKWMAIQPVLQASKIRAAKIFTRGQCPHVALTPAVQVTAAGMVLRMTSSPQTIRREREESAKTAEQVVRAATAKERIVTAIVLDDK